MCVENLNTVVHPQKIKDLYTEENRKIPVMNAYCSIIIENEVVKHNSVKLIWENDSFCRMKFFKKKCFQLFNKRVRLAFG